MNKRVCGPSQSIADGDRRVSRYGLRNDCEWADRSRGVWWVSQSGIRRGSTGYVWGVAWREDCRKDEAPRDVVRTNNDLRIARRVSEFAHSS